MCRLKYQWNDVFDKPQNQKINHNHFTVRVSGGPWRIDDVAENLRSKVVVTRIRIGDVGRVM